MSMFCQVVFLLISIGSLFGTIMILYFFLYTYLEPLTKVRKLKLCFDKSVFRLNLFNQYFNKICLDKSHTKTMVK